MKKDSMSQPGHPWAFHSGVTFKSLHINDLLEVTLPGTGHNRTRFLWLEVAPVQPSFSCSELLSQRREGTNDVGGMQTLSRNYGRHELSRLFI